MSGISSIQCLLTRGIKLMLTRRILKPRYLTLSTSLGFQRIWDLYTWLLVGIDYLSFDITVCSNCLYHSCGENNAAMKV